MKRYWDTSALLNAFWDSRIEKLSREPDQWTRSHTLTEMFPRLPAVASDFNLIRLMPPNCRELTSRMNFVELSSAEVQTALDEAEKRGVRGGRIHDWLHARAAKKAGVEKLLTENFADFAELEDGFEVAAP